MSGALHFQLTLAAPASKVFAALTESAALETWFAEHAAVSLDDERYDFWGRFTPETPSQEEGRRDIQLVELGRRLRYTWPLRGADTTVDFRLTERDGQTIVGLWHRDVPGAKRREAGCYDMGDLWWFWLENLRRYVDGRATARSDFTTIHGGDVTQTVDIDGPPAAVWQALVDPEQRNRWITHDATEGAVVGGTWVDWGKDAGVLRILELVPERKLALGWEIDGEPTVVTWTIEDKGGKTRLTLAHSGFKPDLRTDGEWAGWLSYLNEIQSLVEYGLDWLPPIKEVARNVALYYSASVWARQEELIDEEDEEWG